MGNAHSSKGGKMDKVGLKLTYDKIMYEIETLGYLDNMGLRSHTKCGSDEVRGWVFEQYIEDGHNIFNNTIVPENIAVYT
jgi:hypothetical protein